MTLQRYYCTYANKGVFICAWCSLSAHFSMPRQQSQNFKFPKSNNNKKILQARDGEDYYLMLSSNIRSAGCCAGLWPHKTASAFQND